MKQSIYFLLIILGTVNVLQAQQPDRDKRSRFANSHTESPEIQLPDSLASQDSTKKDSLGIIAYRLTDKLGTPYIAPMDTSWTNFYNRSQVEGYGTAIGYLGNTGSPAQSKIFSERKEERDFIFEDAFDYYRTTPENALFYNTKAPYTDLSYTKAGANINREERLKGVMTMNFGPKINIGGDIDYIYSRGYYNSLTAKLLSYRMFGSYNSDKYSIYAYLDNANNVVHENGGITDDRYITNPGVFTDGKRDVESKDIPVRYTNTWNRVRGKRYFLTHRYNLGYYKEVEVNPADTLAESEVFVPVSSIIHTLDYSDNRRRFVSHDAGIDTTFTNTYINGAPNDTTSSWSIKNTLGLAMREGFKDWAKFGLTAFATFEKRQFTQMDSTVVSSPDSVLAAKQTNFTFNRNSLIHDEYSLTIGAELARREGKILTYNARGELAILGDDIGEFKIEGDLQTNFKLFKKHASVSANGYVKNVRPAYYQRSFHSKFFWWDNDFKNMQRVYVGGDIKLASTRTHISGGVESIQNFLYFNTQGLPQQTDKNLQVLTLRLKQNFVYRALNWENDIVYQASSDQKALPLPDLSVYSNLYVKFKIAKVLNLQLGVDAHYQTSYYAPYYQPATMQFQTQDQVKVGNYPLINAYANVMLKQARFYVMMYNVSDYFVSPNYFSLAHYPLNPTIFKMGVCVLFNN
jgi:hypothetical protein